MQTITAEKLKLGFAGMGWIGKSRMNAILDHNPHCEFTIADPDENVINELKQELSEVQCHQSLDKLIKSNADGIVIASPSALHAPQSIQALQSGKSVFCQKPLGRNAEETLQVVQAAESSNKLLQVDFSYRYTKAMEAVKEVIQSGDLGHIYGVNLTFHNAYGPDKDWYKNPEFSGGGCLMDLGIHLIDLLFWLFDDTELSRHQSQYFHQGNSKFDTNTQVEDYAIAQCRMNDSTSVQLSCSWFLPAGKDAIIEATFYGENGGVSFSNINGSFYDFEAKRFFGTHSEVLISPPDKWEGRAAVKWAEQLSGGSGFDQKAYDFVKVAQELENFYQAKI